MQILIDNIHRNCLKHVLKLYEKILRNEIYNHPHKEYFNRIFTDYRDQ